MGNSIAAGWMSEDGALWHVVRYRCDYAVYCGPDGPIKNVSPR
jgi:hypothetical protein